MPILTIICLPNQGGGPYPYEARLAGTSLRGVGKSVLEAIDDLWTSPAHLVLEELESWRK